MFNVDVLRLPSYSEGLLDQNIVYLFNKYVSSKQDSVREFLTFFFIIFPPKVGIGLQNLITVSPKNNTKYLMANAI